jgi:hypothetical protein
MQDVGGMPSAHDFGAPGHPHVHDEEDAEAQTREDRRRAAFEAAAEAWTGQSTGDARVEEVFDIDDFIFDEDVGGAGDDDVWDPAEESEPRGVDLEDAELDDTGYALFIANLEAELLRELQNPGERAAISDRDACHSQGSAELEKADRDLLRAVVYKLKHNGVTEAAFRDLPYVYPDANTGELPTWKEARHRLAQLAALQPRLIDCCVNSCLAYTGPRAELTQCPYAHCKEKRRDAAGKPRKQFSYLPLIPRLVAFFACHEQNGKMTYRSEFTHNPDVVKDVFDGCLYRSLISKFVAPVVGAALGTKYFADPRDLALGLSTDGYAPFKKRKKTAWPILLFNYNLPPDVRFHQDEVLCVGVVPGPKKPIDFDSFLWPLVEELLDLELGVTAWDAAKQEQFTLRAHLLLVFGDMPAVAMMMRMKGHNGLCPCRFCHIRGIRTPDSSNNILYAPLDRTRHPSALDPRNVAQYDPLDLPLRTHAEFLAQAREVQFAPRAGIREDLAKLYGIKGIPLLSYLSSISFPHSFPYDFMHLIWENLLPNMMQHWQGSFKTFGPGPYTVSEEDWKSAGRASEAAGATLPSAFGPSPPNIAADGISWTADTRSFWALHVGPIVLLNRLPEPYYRHYMDLVDLLHMCMEFDMDAVKVDVLRAGFATWVTQYERCVDHLHGSD